MPTQKQKVRWRGREGKCDGDRERERKEDTQCRANNRWKINADWRQMAINQRTNKENQTEGRPQSLMKNDKKWMALNKNIKWQEAKRFCSALVVGQLNETETNDS